MSCPGESQPLEGACPLEPRGQLGAGPGELHILGDACPREPCMPEGHVNEQPLFAAGAELLMTHLWVVLGWDENQEILQALSTLGPSG